MTENKYVWIDELSDKSQNDNTFLKISVMWRSLVFESALDCRILQDKTDNLRWFSGPICLLE